MRSEHITQIDLHKFSINDDGPSGSFPFNELPQIIMKNVLFKLFFYHHHHHQYRKTMANK